MSVSGSRNRPGVRGQGSLSPFPVSAVNRCGVTRCSRRSEVKKIRELEEDSPIQDLAGQRIPPLVEDDVDVAQGVVNDVGKCANLSWKLKRLQTLWFDGIGRNNIKPVRERSRDEESVTFGEKTQEEASTG